MDIPSSKYFSVIKKLHTDFKHRPNELMEKGKNIFPDYNLYYCGPFEERIYLLLNKENSKGCIFSFERQITLTNFYNSFYSQIKIDSPYNNHSYLEIDVNLVEKIVKPDIYLVALYHPENFPLPRFPLGISDICRAIRQEHCGTIALDDMQVGTTLEDILKKIQDKKPDIIGISITFGQQDLLESLLESIDTAYDERPLIVVGGSLAALNYEMILNKYPFCIIGTSTGEPTFVDIVKYWRGELGLNEVRNVAFIGEIGKIIKTGAIKPQHPNEGIPELDLLENILNCYGVMQLESTRGCSYACSFCPRSHKGIWISQSINLLDLLLPEISKIYEKYHHIAKKIFLVDEEFIGYREESATNERINSIIEAFYTFGFTFETSARVDQVYRKNRDGEWHVKRIKLWKDLNNKVLDRVLFGVESGVDSILKRFNKKTTALQNINAIRVLSACNIPVRLTYIMFDPLMTFDELLESFHFLGRKDLLLKPLLDVSEEKILNIIHDETNIHKYLTGKPLYTEITYMLVSLECLIGSSYLKLVEDHGLAGEYKYSMGKRHAEYVDKRIGFLSYVSQLWIDRNFAVDYTLKSIEKVTKEKLNRLHVRSLREILRKYSYDFLAMSIDVLNSEDAKTHNSVDYMNYFVPKMDEHFTGLVHELITSVEKKSQIIEKGSIEKLYAITDKWKYKKEWKLINDF